MTLSVSGMIRSIRLDARELDRLDQFLGFIGERLADFHRRRQRSRPPLSWSSRALIARSARPALISRLSVGMTAAGVLRGTPIPIAR